MSVHPVVALVLNPVKVGDVDDLADRLRERCRAAGLPDPLVLPTTAEDPGHGQTRQALDAGVDLVVVAGGDGTIRVVAEVLTGTGVPLAVLPQGTGNLLARNLDLPLDVDTALDAVVHGEDRAVDVGRLSDPGGACDGSIFTIMAGAGFDAAMMQEAPEGLKHAVGWPAYLLGGLRGLRRAHARIDVSLDGAPPRRARVRTVLIANVGSLQGGLRLAPDARPDDGLLDVILVSPRRVTDWIVLLVRGLTGRGREDRRLRTYQVRRVRIRMHRPQPRQIDGDLIADSTELTAEVEPGALVVRFPASAATPDADEPVGAAASSDRR
jgi:YegS/Rv2252/BmrU family lipid kinase